MATMSGGGLRLDSLVNLGFEFKPTLAMSAKAFDILDLDIRSFRVPLKRSIQQVAAPSIGKNFTSHGRPEAWQPYAEDTVTMKMNDPKNKYGPEDLLRRSGLLWKTMQQLNVWTITTNQAAILALPDKIWYGGLHQAGYGISAAAVTPAKGMFASPEELSAMGGAGKVRIPARPFAMFQTEDLDKIQEVFATWMMERATARLGLTMR